MKHYKAPLEEHKFKQLVKNYGFKIVSASKHHKIVFLSNGEVLMYFAIDHSKNGKREVKPVYINLFLKKIQEIEE